MMRFRPTHLFASLPYVLLTFLLTTALQCPWAAPTGQEVWQALFEKGDIDAALASFREAAEANPADALAHAGLGYLSPSRDAENEEPDHFLQALRHGVNRPEAVLYLLEAAKETAEKDDAEKVLGTIRSLLQTDGLKDELHSLLLFYQAELLKRQGRWDEAKDAYRQNGLLTQFWYAGPFDNAEKGGHSRVYEPEAAIDLNVEYPGKRRTVGWRPIPLQPYDGYIDVSGFVEPSREAVTYLAAALDSEFEQRCTLRFGHAGALKVWLNGNLVADVDRYHSPIPDQVNVDARLQEGANSLLIKLSSGQSGKYGLYARLQPEDSEAVRAIDPADPAAQPDFSSHARGAGQQAPNVLNLDPPAIRHFKAVVDAPGAKTLDHVYLSLLLQRMDVIDENDPSAINIFSQLNIQHADNPVLLRFLGESERLPNRQRLSYEKALEADSSDQQSFLKLLEYYRSSPYATKGYELIRDWEKEKKLPKPARLTQAQILRDDGLGEAAYHLLRQHEEDLGAEGLWKQYQIGQTWLTDGEEAELLDRVIEKDPDHLNALIARRNLLLRKGEEDRIKSALAHELQIRPYSINGYLELTRYFIAVDEYERALETLEKALRITPENYELNRLAATALHGLDRDDEALIALQEALTTQPSDAWALDYRELLQTEQETYAAAYKRDWREIEIPETLDLTKANYVRLFEQKVLKVHQNGNSSETYREAVKVLTDTGVRMQQYRGIYYVDETEEVRVQRARVWKPDGTFYDAPAPMRRSTASGADADNKLYGDSFVCILSFPALEKGAVIEIEYEKESKKDNIYADYFGDLFFIGDGRFEPTVQSEYILIASKKRDLYWKYTEPHYPASIQEDRVQLNSEPEMSETDSERTYHWTFAHLPTIPREPLMPSASEILPYVKVSTFRTWSDMAQWYWNLMREQIIPGAVVKNKVQQVLSEYRRSKGIDIEKPLSDWDKVSAINQYVNTGVRYLGLEFGIHGFKPHKVDEICNAQYGDCKDKAVLALTMLNEVGVEAHITILRTTDRGEIDYELPFLGLFNHAIYYLPNVDGKEYWIDGTATFFDAKELPSGDMGAYSLIIKPGGEYEFIRIPYSEAAENNAHYTTALALDAQGNAMGYRVGEFSGLYNPMARRTYENAAKAKEIIDQMLAGKYPGANSSNIQLSNMADYTDSESVSYELSIPQLAAQQGSELRIPVTLSEESFSRRYAQLSEREYDLVLSYPSSKTNITTLSLPEGYRVTILPPDQKVENEFGRYTRTIVNQDGKITIKENIELECVRVPKEKYAEFREFCRIVDLYQEEKITVKMQETL